MASTEKITILLADEDALRRDGLAAVLQGVSQLEVVAQCPDGEAALGEIRKLRPDVAVVDLNLPKLHGIEVVRRVRGEALGTKIVILAGTSDDDIIREVVRAGADGYLLKNGPARHLIDAISYVRDGGQYFSPQLRRDGLDRRILEEPPRVPPERDRADASTRPADSSAEEDAEAWDRDEERAPRRAAASSRAARARRGRSEPSRLRERLRADSGPGNLEERDYEILDMMAEGIRPILDRLDEIEGRVGEMESGESPVPGDVRNWLSAEIADTFGDGRSQGREVALGRSLNDLEARLPQLIEEAVTSRFHNMASKLQQEIEETHVRTLETFVKNIQVKLVQRVSALETDMSKQAEAMNQLREYSQRTEDNLSRLITGVDKLAQELPKRLAAAAAEPVAPPIVHHVPDPQPEPRRVRHRSARTFSPKLFWICVASAVVVIAAAFGVTRLLHSTKPAAASAASGVKMPATGAKSEGVADPSAAAGKPAPPSANADTKTKMLAAEQYTDNKDYSTAEDIYRQVLKAEPGNVEAMKALASVLYREDKIEESAALLDKLPKN